MKWLKIELPDKTFGIETSLLVMFLPTLGVVILAILSFGWVVSPRIDDYNALKLKTTATLQKTGTLTEKISYLKTMDIDQLNRDGALVNNALLPQKNSYLLVNIIRQLSESYGFSVDSFSVSMSGLKGIDAKSPTASTDGFATVPVQVTLIGSANNYVDFISAIEQSLPLMSLTKFEVNRTGDVAVLNLIISAYYSSEKNSVDINNLTLADLTLKKDEGDLVAKISQYKTIQNLDMVEGQLKLNQSFIPYDRGNPFAL